MQVFRGGAFHGQWGIMDNHDCPSLRPNAMLSRKTCGITFTESASKQPQALTNQALIAIIKIARKAAT